MATPWREHLKRANKYLLRNKELHLGVLVGEEEVQKRCRLRVASKPDERGWHHIQLDGYWRGNDVETSRRLHTKLKPKDIAKSFHYAVSEAEKLIMDGQMGLETRRNLETFDGSSLRSMALTEKAMMKKAKSYLEERAITRGLADFGLNRSLKWVEICFAYGRDNNKKMSMQTCADALLQHYGCRKRKAYKNAFDIMKLVCKELNQPIGVEERQRPAYQYQPKFRSNIPSDDVLWERIDRIRCEEEKKLVYAITVYGHRVMQIYSTRWDELDVKSGYVPYWATKNNKLCSGVPCTFGDHWIDLSGWKPEKFDELFVWGERPSGDVEQKRMMRSSQLSKLVHDRLEVTATDMRHRYCSVSLMTGLHTASTCAAAVGNSAAMIDKTYSHEINLYLERKMRG